jgi:hypothetical protein
VQNHECIVRCIIMNWPVPGRLHTVCKPRHVKPSLEIPEQNPDCFHQFSIISSIDRSRERERESISTYRTAIHGRNNRPTRLCEDYNGDTFGGTQNIANPALLTLVCHPFWHCLATNVIIAATQKCRSTTSYPRKSSL